jgi:hypothetical protein
MTKKHRLLTSIRCHKSSSKKLQDNNYDKKTPSMVLPSQVSTSFLAKLVNYKPAKFLKNPNHYLMNGEKIIVTVDEAKKMENGNKN